MRRPHRQIEIFSISTLDLFASALGAFILIAIILFPYYLKDQDSAAKLQDREHLLRETREKLTAQVARADALEKSMEQMRTGTVHIVLFIAVSWDTAGADVDLHVTDPQGNEFYWYKSNANGQDYPSSKGQLSPDMTSGPAVEFWQDADATPGTYTVDYVANALPEGYTVEVHGMILDRDGRLDLSTRKLTRAKQRMRGGVLLVEKNGHVQIQ